MYLNVPKQALCLAFIILTTIKFSLAIYTIKSGLWIFGEGNDADYYHSYALGNVQDLANFWSLLLRELNEYGLYSRDGVKLFLMLLGFVVIPIMIAELGVRCNAGDPKLYWTVVVLISAYPTLCYYALDIYRDVLLCFVFLMSVCIVNKFILSRDLGVSFIALVAIAAMSYMMFLLRPYLGVSFAAAFLVSFVLSCARWPLWLYCALYLIALNGFYAVGGLDSLLMYRSIFDTALRGGSNLGLSFDSVFLFLPVFLKNFAIQMLGLYFSKFIAVFFFLIESVPFIAGAIYLLLNRRFADRLLSFLVLFFVFYGTIWLIGNDNMGTAVRLRMCNYLALALCVVIVYSNKRAQTLQGGL